MHRETRTYSLRKNYAFTMNDHISYENGKRIYQLHFHSEYEFIYVTEGEMNIQVQQESFHLSKGDIFAVSSLKPHFTNMEDKAKFMLLIVPVNEYIINSSPELYTFFFNSQISSSNFCSQLHRKSDDYLTAINIFEQIYRENNEQNFGYEYVTTSLINQLLLIYARTVNANSQYKPSQPFDGCEKVLNYIDDNLSKKIHLSELCKITNYGYTYFSKKFKEAMGISLSEYIISRRIRLAKSLLVSTDLPIGVISDKCGFSNQNDIYKKFSAIVGTSPLQYRKRYNDIIGKKTTHSS